MAVKIYVEPDDTWDFFDDNLYRLKEEMVLIAENEETEILSGTGGPRPDGDLSKDFYDV